MKKIFKKLNFKRVAALGSVLLILTILVLPCVSFSASAAVNTGDSIIVIVANKRNRTTLSYPTVTYYYNKQTDDSILIPRSEYPPFIGNVPSENFLLYDDFYSAIIPIDLSKSSYNTLFDQFYNKLSVVGIDSITRFEVYHNGTLVNWSNFPSNNELIEPVYNEYVYVFYTTSHDSSVDDIELDISFYLTDGGDVPGTYEDGFEDGYNQGLQVSQGEAYDKGYSDGFNVGSSESFGDNLLGATLAAPITALNSFVIVSTPLGNITLGAVVGSVIALSLFIMFLKYFAGG